ncbi:MAG: zinc-dependent alcohol dehydrogenase [Acetivibrionales bacterium]|jgi:2-desacetyl-2-hydroxyethyl bacteriochlorophyllide A dehydrogenase
MKGFEIRGKGDVGLRYDVPMPKLGMNEALIKIKYCGICGSDTHQYHTGINLQSGGKPYILGHEFVGTVVESNDDGNVLYKIGDIVTGRPFFSCGVCDNCRNGRESICDNVKLMTLAKDGNGAYAEYAKLPSKVIFPLRKDIDLKVAALSEPLAVAMFDVRMSNFKPGQSAFISGGGVIGALIGIYCRFIGASSVVFSEVNHNRIKFLESLGFTAFNPAKEDVLEKAIKTNNGRLFDAVFEVCGVQESYDLCLKACRRGGMYMFVGVTTTPKSFNVRHVLVSQITIKGVNMYETSDYYQAVQLINSKKLEGQLKPFITDIYPLEQAYEAYMYAMSKEGKHVKVLIDCDS